MVSKSWKFFTKETINGELKRKCLICGEMLTTPKDSSTSNMIKHLRTKGHEEAWIFPEIKSEKEEVVPKRRGRPPTKNISYAESPSTASPIASMFLEERKKVFLTPKCEYSADHQSASKQLEMTQELAAPSHCQQQQQTMEPEPMCARLFVELMTQLYGQGWVLGSSGGMAACTTDSEGDGLLLVSPSSVPKERLKEWELFAFSLKCIQERSDDVCLNAQPLLRPTHLKPSACTPLFLLLLQSTPNASCVIHTHSKYANLVTVLYAQNSCLEISNQEMLKGVMDRRSWQPFQNTDCFSLPIVENKPQEQDLLPALKRALEEYPHTPAILVRRHGLFVWGPSWQKTKVMLECLEYLFELLWEMGKTSMSLANCSNASFD